MFPSTPTCWACFKVNGQDGVPREESGQPQWAADPPPAAWSAVCSELLSRPHSTKAVATDRRRPGDKESFYAFVAYPLISVEKVRSPTCSLPVGNVSASRPCATFRLEDIRLPDGFHQRPPRPAERHLRRARPDEQNTAVRCWVARSSAKLVSPQELRRVVYECLRWPGFHLRTTRNITPGLPAAGRTVSSSLLKPSESAQTGNRREERGPYLNAPPATPEENVRAR